MKPMIYSAIAALLVLSSCSTAYQTAQTPDDVYYSPGKAKVYANNTRSTQQQASNADEETYNDNGDDNYVTYQDEDEERYDYARRIDRFSRGYSGSYWDGYYADQFYGGPSIYMNNYYGFGYPTWGNSFSIGLGWGYNPYRWNSWYGNGWYGGGGYYGHPWYNNWYGGSGWYGSGWYGGGGYYPGGGWHGGGGYYTPRPSNSWGPRGSSSSRVFNDRYNNSTPRPNTSGSAPRRVFDRSNGGNVVNPGNTGGRVNNGGVPRRTFDRAPSERPATQPGSEPSSRPARQAPVRNYDRSDDRPVRQSSPEPTYRAPAPERSVPERSYPSSSPSSSPSNSSPAPVRQSSPRRGG